MQSSRILKPKIRAPFFKGACFPWICWNQMFMTCFYMFYLFGHPSQHVCRCWWRELIFASLARASTAFFLATLGTQPYSLGLMAEGDIKSQCCIHVWYFANIYSSWFGTMAGVKWAVVAPEDVQSGLCKIFFQKVSLWVSCMSCMVFIIWGLRGFSVPHLDLHSRFLFVQTHDMHACMHENSIPTCDPGRGLHAWSCMNMHE